MLLNKLSGRLGSAEMFIHYFPLLCWHDATYTTGGSSSKYNFVNTMVTRQGNSLKLTTTV